MPTRATHVALCFRSFARGTGVVSALVSFAPPATNTARCCPTTLGVIAWSTCAKGVSTRHKSWACASTAQNASHCCANEISLATPPSTSVWPMPGRYRSSTTSKWTLRAQVAHWRRGARPPAANNVRASFCWRRRAPAHWHWTGQRWVHWHSRLRACRGTIWVQDITGKSNCKNFDVFPTARNAQSFLRSIVVWKLFTVSHWSWQRYVRRWKTLESKTFWIFTATLLLGRTLRACKRCFGCFQHTKQSASVKDARISCLARWNQFLQLSRHLSATAARLLSEQAEKQRNDNVAVVADELSTQPNDDESSSDEPQFLAVIDGEIVEPPKAAQAEPQIVVDEWIPDEQLIASVEAINQMTNQLIGLVRKAKTEKRTKKKIFTTLC